MKKYIERGDIEKWLLTETASLDGEEDRQYVVERLRNEIPAADVAPVRHGRWRLGGYGQISDAKTKWYDQFLQGSFLYCSECKGRTNRKTNYCHNCGAKMDGGGGR